MPRPNTGPRLKWIERRQSYYIVWYEQGAQRLRATGFVDRRQAETALAAFIGLSHRKPDAPREPGAILISDVLSIYGEGHAPKAADPARIGYAIDALLPFWGGLTVADVTEAQCERYANQRGRAPATVRRELTTMRAAINYAVRTQHLARAVPVKLPDKPQGRDRWLTHSEAARLLNASRTGRADVRLYLPLFVLIALYTGARKEAILSLRWSQVDLERGRINFAQPGARRTTKGRALLPIPRRLMTFLRLAKKRGDGFVIHDKGNQVIDIGGGWNGDPDSRGQGSFGGACKRAGLAGVTPHTLRHTRGTWLAHAGVDLWKIAGWLGQSLATTTELYAHHHPDFMEDARDAADRRNRRAN